MGSDLIDLVRSLPSSCKSSYSSSMFVMADGWVERRTILQFRGARICKLGGLGGSRGDPPGGGNMSDLLRMSDTLGW